MAVLVAGFSPAVYGASPPERDTAAPSAAPGTEVAAGDNDPITADRLGNGLPASGATAEIPAAADPNSSQELNTGEAAAEADSVPDEVQTEDPESELPPHVYSLQDFVSRGVDESPLGIEVREDCSKLKTHQRVCGLAVLDVRSGSPADRAGIKRYTALTHDLLDGASVAAALVFPPAIVAVAVIDQSGIGESFDLVIGVDGRRVRHILDFQDLTANVQPGDTVYLSIVRAGKRVQVPVRIPAGAATFRN